MSLRYDLKPEYIFEWERKWELNLNTIISPKIQLTYDDLNFEIQNKNIISFQLLILQRKHDIIKFDKLHKNWSYELEITQNTILKIYIKYFNEEDRNNVIRRDWQEFIHSSQT